MHLPQERDLAGFEQLKIDFEITWSTIIKIQSKCLIL
jgi:hypothetical protein